MISVVMGVAVESEHIIMYSTARVYLDAGEYSLEDLRNLVKSLELLNKANEKTMKKEPWHEGWKKGRDGQ